MCAYIRTGVYAYVRVCTYTVYFLFSSENDFYRQMVKLRKNTQEVLNEMDVDSKVCIWGGVGGGRGVGGGGRRATYVQHHFT